MSLQMLITFLRHSKLKFLFIPNQSVSNHSHEDIQIAKKLNYTPNDSAEYIGDDNSKKSSTLSSNQNNTFRRIPYPKHIFLIIGNEFCERFNYYGMRTIQVLYLKNKLGFSEADATVQYHAFTTFVFFMCFFGGIVSDVWLGKFKTILYLSIIYSIGSTIVSISAIPTIDINLQKIAWIAGLALIGVGSGGIKPNVSAFGGDQFKLPEQAKQMDTFFSLFYFAITAGSLISSLITPILREDVHCFGEMDCFSLAFGTPAVLMLVSIVLFLIGKPLYTYERTSTKNMLVEVTRCISNAIRTKLREGRDHPHKKLLDFSIEKYGEQLVNETRSLLRILVLYLPLPFFWALYDQKGSRWVFQGTKMDGDIGFYTIKPDQMLMLNPLLVVLFIPLFDALLYPLLCKIGIRRPLQKLTIGGILAAVSFFLSSLVQFKIEASDDKSVNILWLVPQYVVMAVAEVMFSVTGLSFSYEQAPESMKSVITALWLLTIAFGDVIIIFITEFLAFDSRAHEFLFFSAFMLVDMLVFMALAYNYKSSN